jgi:two-component system sensor histidine kinase UhpB
MLRSRRTEEAVRRSYSRVRELAGKLISAQERERARIARDMHDDFNQQLAAVSISISALKQRLPGADPDTRDMLHALQERTVALTDRVRDFSRDLHPATLEHAGLAAALRTHCSRFGQGHGLRISLTLPDDLGPIPPDIGVCVFRIAQEGLRNIAQHARVRDAQLSITWSADQLEMTLTDAGAGFDPAAIHGGLGLLSMEERARLVGGDLYVSSTAGRGTTLRLSVPLPPAVDVDRSRRA